MLSFSLGDLEAAFGAVHPLGRIPRGQAVFIADVIRQRRFDSRAIRVNIIDVGRGGTDAVPKEVDVPPLPALIGSLHRCYHDMRALVASYAAYLCPGRKPAHLVSFFEPMEIFR